MTKSFYITTPIYYPSGKLHISSAYTTIACDVFGALQTHDELRCVLPDWVPMSWSRSSRKQKKLDNAASLCRWDGRWWKNSGNSRISYMRSSVRQTSTMKVVTGLWTLAGARRHHLRVNTLAGIQSLMKEFFTSQLAEVFRDENGWVIGGVAPSGHEVEWVSKVLLPSPQ